MCKRKKPVKVYIISITWYSMESKTLRQLKKRLGARLGSMK